MTAKILALCLLPLAYAAEQTIYVGDQGLQILPNSVQAGVGDTIRFQFVTPGHSIVQGNYSKPCEPLSSSSFYSGVLEANMTFTVTINDTKPIFLYCSVARHCQAAMVAVINAGNGQTLNGYRSAAALTTGSDEPLEAQGGVIGSASSSSSAAASSATSTGTTGTSTTAASATSTPKSEGTRATGMSFVGFIGAMAAALASL